MLLNFTRLHLRKGTEIVISIKVDLTLKSPLHIGASAPAGTTAVRGLLKDAQGWPYIPASAFKGRLRHMVERLSKSMERSACDTHHQTCESAHSACPVCQIFGSPWLTGSVRFCDLTLTQPEIWDTAYRRENPYPRTGYRHGVGISRTRRVAQDALLYTTELFQPGVPLVFSGTLQDIETLEDAAWLYAGLQFMESIGSNRTRGLGWIESRIQVIQDDVVIGPEQLRQTLEGSL